MEKLKVGNIVKTKKGQTCVIVDILDDSAIIFNLTKMEPDKIKIKEIKEIIGEANCTTMVVNGKKVMEKDIEVETDEVEEIEKEQEQEESKEDNDPAEVFGELIKLFGKAAIELGNILTKIAESDEDDNKR